MKQLYVALVCCSLLLAFPYSNQAQCTCAAGITPDSIVYRHTLPVTSSPGITISFPKFDPSVGVLTCLTYGDTLSAVSTTNVRNKDSSDQEYRFRLTVTNTISGPGVAINDFIDKFYGPDSLKAFGTGLDSITYGPDTTFQNVTHVVTKTSGLAPYLGLGTVDFNYGISGGLISLSGGLNFFQNINTSRWGNFKLTYYWCPNAVLSSNIKNFSATRRDQDIFLSWLMTNLVAGKYDIEISTDGRNFSSIAGERQTLTTAGTSSKYSYQYHLNQNGSDKLYFRIKETGGDGKIKYSEVKVVSPDAGNEITYAPYPNPAVKGVNVEFHKPVQGDIEVQLINSVGQIVFQKTYRLNQTKILNVEWPFELKTGIYYLKTRDAKEQNQSMSKLFIK